MPLPVALTVYSRKNSLAAKNELRNLKFDFSKVKTQKMSLIFVVNLLLSGVLALFLFFCIIEANGIASNRYSVRELNDDIASLNEMHSSLAANKSMDEAVLMFARNNMVQAENIIHVFENGNVALKR